MNEDFKPGQIWTYDTLQGFERSKVVIGSVEEIPGMGDVICVIVENAPMQKPDHTGLMMAPIHFIPFSREALEKSLLKCEGMKKVSNQFQALYDDWKEDTSGTEFMTVSLPMFLEMIAGTYDPAQ